MPIFGGGLVQCASPGWDKAVRSRVTESDTGKRWRFSHLGDRTCSLEASSRQLPTTQQSEEANSKRNSLDRCALCQPSLLRPRTYTVPDRRQSGPLPRRSEYRRHVLNNADAWALRAGQKMFRKVVKLAWLTVSRSRNPESALTAFEYVLYRSMEPTTRF